MESVAGWISTGNMPKFREMDIQESQIFEDLSLGELTKLNMDGNPQGLEHKIQLLCTLINRLILYGCAVETELEALKVENQQLSCQVETLKETESTPCQTKTDDFSESIGWQGVTDIKKEVEIIAAQVEESRYVYDENSKMYYEPVSGYYYNPENQLFYDYKSGIYFYYDQEKKSYEFHSQINVEETTNNETSNENKDDSCEEEKPVKSPESDSYHYEAYPVVTAPSLRLVVDEGELTGKLFVVTIDGASIGSSKFHDIVLPCLSVSKNHAEISYESKDSDDHHYFVTDSGSTNGTRIANKLQNDPKKIREKVEIGHGWKIWCGEVCMSCHIHPGQNTCNECEPGLISCKTVEYKESQPEVGESKEKSRKRQLKKIKKKVGLLNKKESKPMVENSYTDRASERRKTIGSDNPYEKTQIADINDKIPANNIGMKMMQQMGWKEGDGLGISKSGRTEPITVESTASRSGFGSSLSFRPESNSTVSGPKPIAFLPSSGTSK